MPLRLTVGGKGLAQGIVELRSRRTGETVNVPLDSLVDGVREAAQSEWRWITDMVKPEVIES
jgi:prolyl-tRNA synthetase